MDPYIHARMLELYCKAQNASCSAHVLEYNLYASAVMNGHITWGTHLHAVACRQNIWQPQPTKCVWCEKKNGARHMLEECRYRDIVLYVLYSKLAVLIPDILPSWTQCIPTPADCGYNVGVQPYSYM